MAEQAQRITDLVLELWNNGNADAARQVYSEDGERHDPNSPEPARGAEQIANYVAEVRTAFPDFKVKLDTTISDGDRLVTEWTVTGTHRGQFLGIPATGRSVKISGMTLSRLRDGQIVQDHVYFDRLALLSQLGVAPGGVEAAPVAS